MSYLFLLLLCTFAINLSLAVFVLARNSKKTRNIVFAVFAMGTAGWNLTLYLTLAGFEPQIVWARLPFSFASILGAALLWFVHDFPNRTKHFRFWSRLAVVYGIVFFVLPLTPWMLRTVDISQGYVTGDLNPFVYSYWLGSFIFVLIYSLFRSWIGLRKELGLKRNQAFAVVMGLTMFLLPVLFTNVVLPFLGHFEWNALGPVFTIFFIAFVAHAILKYRFLEIRWVVKRTLDIVFLWMVAFALIYGFNIALLQSTEITLVQLLSSLAIAFVYIPASRIILSLSAKLAMRGTYNLTRAQEQISLISRSVDDLDKLQKEVTSLFRKFLGYRKVAIATFSLGKDQEIIASYKRGYTARDIEDDHVAILRMLVKLGRNTMERAEIDWLLRNEQAHKDVATYRKLFSLLEAHDIDVVIPFTIGKTQVALALVSDKRDAKLLTKRDLFLIRLIQGSLAPALANAARYERMQSLYKELQEADSVKGEFIDVVSHQFRTPLTAILWDAELSLDQKPKPVAVRDSLLDITQRANFIRTVLLQMFDLLELQSNKMRVVSQSVALPDIVHEVLNKDAQVCKTRDISMVLNLQPVSVKADPRHLTSVIERLIENACVYSQVGGEVMIETGSNEKTGEAMLTITDHGIGMSRATLKQVFKKFYRGTEAKKEKPNGTGLSLFLSNEILRLMQGRITVDSKLGKGSAFTIHLPKL